MRLEVVSVNVVVTASSHNPSILHPAFLTSQGIVDTDWRLSEPPVCTPVLSLVKYENGIVFTAESEKLQVLDNEPGDDPASSLVPTLANQYVTKLPHVRYTGVGVNVKGFVEVAEARRLLVDRFLRPGPWNEPSLSVKALGVRLVYDIEGGRRRLSLDAGGLSRGGGPNREGIVIDANYHSKATPPDLVTAVREALDRFPRHCEDFGTTTRTVLCLE